MKRFRILAVTLSFLVLVAMPVGCAGPETIFPDGNLEAAIRDALGKPAGEEITAAELLNLTTLWALFSDITDLTGLEYCTNLTELNIYGNQISDISLLSSLTNLTVLFLSGNHISDISALVDNSGLDSEDKVWLEDNNLDLSEGSEDIENIRALEDRGVVVHHDPLQGTP